jgi:wyosine [tRNA(Phe)-imidazoG37] synthetase (radical SAM superfamily)
VQVRVPGNVLLDNNNAVNKNKTIVLAKYAQNFISRITGKKAPYNLHDLLPLRTPGNIMIDPSNLCNFRCSFCPTSDSELMELVKRPMGMMDYSLFCRIVDDIKGFPERVGFLTLYKDGEPFLNKNIGKMIAYAKESDVADIVRTTSNGSLISRKRAVEVIEAGLDRIRISVAGVSDEGYGRITNSSVSYETVRGNVETLFDEREKRKSSLEIHAKILDTDLSEEEKKKFLKDFEGLSDTVSIEPLHGWSFSEKKDFTLGYSSEPVEEGKAETKQERKVCPDPFSLWGMRVQRISLIYGMGTGCMISG